MVSVPTSGTFLSPLGGWTKPKYVKIPIQVWIWTVPTLPISPRDRPLATPGERNFPKTENLRANDGHVRRMTVGKRSAWLTARASFVCSIHSKWAGLFLPIPGMVLVLGKNRSKVSLKFWTFFYHFQKKYFILLANAASLRFGQCPKGQHPALRG